MRVKFDHIEAHVSDIGRYCRFLQSLFEGGMFEIISDSGTSMFTSPDGIRIEVKKKAVEDTPVMSGFCNPCIRRRGAKDFIIGLGLEIEKELSSQSGMVYFFRDHERTMWHIKDVPAGDAQ